MTPELAMTIVASTCTSLGARGDRVSRALFQHSRICGLDSSTTPSIVALFDASSGRPPAPVPVRTRYQVATLSNATTPRPAKRGDRGAAGRGGLGAVDGVAMFSLRRHAAYHTARRARPAFGPTAPGAAEAFGERPSFERPTSTRAGAGDYFRR